VAQRRVVCPSQPRAAQPRVVGRLDARRQAVSVIDEFTRRCPAIVVGRKLNSDEHDCVTHLFVAHGEPENVRSDNSPEFVGRNLRAWLGRIGVKMLFIEPGSPWENGYCEGFKSKLRDELMAGELFSTLYEAKVRRSLGR
jgi:putative transposase